MQFLRSVPLQPGRDSVSVDANGSRIGSLGRHTPCHRSRSLMGSGRCLRPDLGQQAFRRDGRSDARQVDYRVSDRAGATEERNDHPADTKRTDWPIRGAGRAATRTRLHRAGAVRRQIQAWNRRLMHGSIPDSGQKASHHRGHGEHRERHRGKLRKTRASILPVVGWHPCAPPRRDIWVPPPHWTAFSGYLRGFTSVLSTGKITPDMERTLNAPWRRLPGGHGRRAARHACARSRY